MIKIIASILMFVSIPSALAEEKTGFYGNAELGVTLNTGNTDAKTTTAKTDLYYEIARWRFNVNAYKIYGVSSSVTIADKFLIQGKADYKFSKYDYLFNLTKYEIDRFSGFDFEFTESLGYGRRLIDSETVTLDLEAGPGYYIQQFSGISNSELTGRAGADFKWTVSESATFSEDFDFLIGESTTVGTKISSETALKLNISGHLAMKNSFLIKYASVVPFGKQTTDTTTAVTLVYDLK